MNFCTYFVYISHVKVYIVSFLKYYSMDVVNSIKKKSKRIFYFDALRALAIISVIIFHIFLITRKDMVAQYSVPTVGWFLEDIMGACFRCGVDLFLMLSGALSLGRVWDIKSFLGKRIPRITLPFLFWGFVLSIILVVLSYYVPGVYHYVESFTLFSILDLIKNSYMSVTYSFGPYWFFWMILGTYLIMPILNKWLLHADLKEAEYFLFFWLITCLFTYTLKMEFPITLTYFTGPIGCVVLGYYLRHTKRKLFNNPYFSLAIFIISNVLLVFASYMMSDVHHFKYFDRYSIYIVFQVFGIFLLFKNFSKFNIQIKFLNNPNGIFKRLIFAIAKYSYGIYLVHEFFLKVIFVKVLQPFPLRVTIPIYLFGSLFGSMILLALLNRIPYVNQAIGAK